MPLRPALASPAASIEIGRARLVRAEPGDRERLGAALEIVTPGSIGLPRGAVLVVPRLRVAQLLSKRTGNDLFARAITEALAGALRSARRPGEAGSAEDSWLFEDDAEMAAAVIRAWLDAPTGPERTVAGIHLGEARSWWRRHILPDGRLLPRVVARLAEWRRAEPWLAVLEPSEVATALAAVSQAYGGDLPAIAFAGHASTPPAGRGRAGVRLRRETARLAEVCPEVRMTALPPAARSLLIVAMLAQRRPALLRSAGFGEALAALSQGAPPARRVRSGAPFDGPAGETPPEAPRPAPEWTPEEPQRTGREAQVPAHPPASPGVASDEPGEGLETAFGGLLFLVNALIALGIYGDFTRPQDGLAGLSPCGLLLRLGRRWFGQRFCADPIAALLRRLSRHDPRAFRPDPWRVPQDWLAPWPDAGPPVLCRDGARSTLWHAAGFPLRDAQPPRDCTAAAPVRRLPATDGARWVASLADYLAARLAAATGASDRRAAVRLVCLRPATVAVEHERIEACFDLEDHPLAIRIAGLDRDPGWVPAAAMTFVFRFQ
jgi:hypothetical protein